jgi:ABC-type multidrug transport system ATPase subunit
MKRKLSVGIAFIGGSKIVLLDEPTSGMDPYSRRFTWNVIRKMKEGRTIILTTHFMDEADLLGDRIAIMADGKLRCAGSSLFLKQRFGVGYMMAIEKGPSFDEKRVKGMVKQAVPDVKLLSNIGSEMTMQLPLSASENFQSLFEAFDADQKQLGIINYGVSVTTLEEVFLKVAHGGDEDQGALHKQKSDLALKKRQSSISPDPSSPSSSDNTFKKMEISGDQENPLHSSSIDSFSDVMKANQGLNPANLKKLNVNNNCGYFMRHISALLMKRMMYFLRDKKAWIFGFVIPSAFVLLGMFIVSIIPTFFEQPPLVLSLGSFNPGTTNPVPYNKAGQSVVTYKSSFDPASQENANVWMVMDSLQFDSCNANPNTNTPCAIPADTSYMPSVVEGIDPYEMPSNVQDWDDISSWLLDTRDTKAGSRYGTIISITDGASPAANDISSIEGSSYLIATNATAFHSAPTFMMGLYKGVFESMGWDDVSVETTLHPLPATNKQMQFESVQNTMFAVLMILLGFPFIPSSFIMFVVREKENKSKHIQLVSGVSPHAFWISTWIFDFVSYQIPLWATVGILKGFESAKQLTEGENFDATIYLLLGYGPAMAGFCYCLSFVFKSHSAAQIAVIFFSFLTGFILAIASFIMAMIESTQDLNKTLLNVYRLIPGFNLGHGLLSITAAPIITFFDNPDATEVYGAMHPLVAGDDIKWMTVEAFAYTFLAIIIEYIIATPSLFAWAANCIYRTPPQADFEPDDDVIDEEGRCAELALQRVNGQTSENDEAILLSDITKVYPGGKFAVKGVSVGIPYGQCFGLLGINGAGKTTTLSMLSGEFPPSGGGAWLAGKDILTAASEVRRLIGYCPQFDALFELMTGYEHLKMYARIKGIKEEDIEACVQEQIVRMDLTQHAFRLAGGYSGGNKRKLSVACAMIGQPSIIFLDEPSTGMDPVARRFMWSVINDICCQGDTSVILTTHSMEECEALCQR